jgi:predicted MFS family arabinose efflux permease
MLYSITAGLTFLYGLLISGYLIDRGGVKLSLVLGSLFLTSARFLVTFGQVKWLIYLTFMTLIPLGMSLYVPVMILAINQTTTGKTRQLGYSLFYAFLSLGYVLGGPFVDFVRAYLPITKFTLNSVEYSVNAYKMVFGIGFALSFLSFLLILFCYNGKRNQVI